MNNDNSATADPRIESDMPLAISATPTDDEDALGKDIKQQNDKAMAISYGHMRVLQPAGGQQPVPDTIDRFDAAVDGNGEQYVNGAGQEAVKPMTPETNPAILDLANNDDLDIATIARQANKEINKAPDEVEIRLH